MNKQIKPLQKIIFGSPGTGKSFQVRTIASEQLGIGFDEDFHFLNHNNILRTVFHPEYTYADFMGKLLPLTQKDQVIYKFYPGHFLRILGSSYNNLLEPEGESENFLLVIDELNRGNASSIFGPVFQLLDRENDGWSSYEVDISDMELVGLLEAMNLKPKIDDGLVQIGMGSGGSLPYETILRQKAGDNLSNDAERVIKLLEKKRISIPRNLSVIATINTSDESIYYLDSAFKRRWDWEYTSAPSAPFSNSDVPTSLRDSFLIVNDQVKGRWSTYIVGINEFIKSNSQSIRRIEDKQIGWWFLKPDHGNNVTLEKVKDKILFYLWDSVFSRDKRPLENLLSDGFSDVHLRLYSDFLDSAEDFMQKIYLIGLEGKEEKERAYDNIPF